MKRMFAFLLLIAGLCASAQTNNTKPDLSPAERSIAEARKSIEKKPTQYAGYNQLAMALARRARETSEVTYYAQAGGCAKEII